MGRWSPSNHVVMPFGMQPSDHPATRMRSLVRPVRTPSTDRKRRNAKRKGPDPRTESPGPGPRGRGHARRMGVRGHPRPRRIAVKGEALGSTEAATRARPAGRLTPRSADGLVGSRRHIVPGSSVLRPSRAVRAARLGGPTCVLRGPHGCGPRAMIGTPAAVAASVRMLGKAGLGVPAAATRPWLRP